MHDMSETIRNMVPISLFNRGLAGKVFEDVRKNGAKVVIKNNVPECVLLSPDDYLKIMDELNDFQLYMLAGKRMENYNPSKAIPAEKVFEELGITDSDLEDFDEVEIE